MKKFLISIFLLSCTLLNAQESDEYIITKGKTFQEALYFLSIKIGVTVNVNGEMTVSEMNKKFSESFTETKTIESFIKTSGVDVNYENGIYVAKFNKTGYIRKHLEGYRKCMANARSLKGTNVKHEMNLILGCYFDAYNYLDDDMMKKLYDTDAMKNDIIALAKDIYRCGDYGILYFFGRECGGCAIRVCNYDSMFGFQYRVNGGDYLMPEAYSMTVTSNFINRDGFDNKNYRTCYVPYPVNSRITYRKLYERYNKDTDRYEIIDVPNNWYFKELFVF